MARNLLKTWPALWTFADHNGVQPTNNHAQQQAAILQGEHSDPRPGG